MRQPQAFARTGFASYSPSVPAFVAAVSRAASSRRRTLCVALIASLTFAGLSAAPAFAERSYDSQITGFRSPWGIAIDSSDHVWVSDSENGGLISEYDAYPSQTKIGEQSGAGKFSGYYIHSLAVNSSNNDLYVADSGPVVVDVFDGSGQYVSQWSGFGGGYDYVAVDNSGGPKNGDVYVAYTPSSVKAFDTEHNEVNFSASAGYINGAVLTGTPSGSFGRVWNVATDAAGDIYVLDQGKSEVDEFAPSGTYLRSFTGAGAPGGFSSSLTGVAVDPTNENVLVVDEGNDVVDEFESSGAFAEQLTGTGPSQENHFGSLHGGIAVNSGGYVYVADGSQGAVDIFTPSAVLPKVTYEPATNQTQTSGTLNASINLNEGPEVTSCTFEYGTTTGYGSSAPCSPAAPYTSETDVSAELSGLTTEHAYHYRVVLVTENGIKKAPDQVYVPHAVAALSTQPANPVERNTATLNGTLEGNGEDTHYYFEWGPTTAYGNKTPVEDAGSSTGVHPESADLSGLTVETTYHFRFVAENAAGTTYGEDQSFKTLAAVENLTTEPATNVTATTATLNATYSGIGEEVHYYFEWGTDTSYGHDSAAPPGIDAGSPSGQQSPSFGLAQLSVNTTYHYRIVATDASGTSYGADRTFTTLGRYEFDSTFGSTGSGDGQLLHPSDVALDQSTGDVYVADAGNHRVVRFSSSGAFISTWGWGVQDGSAARETCTSDCRAGLPGSEPGQFTTPQFIEVDNSGGPSQGDVYVADVNDGVVQKFDPSGDLIESWGTEGGINFSHGGTIGGITVDEAGNLYVLTDNTPYFWTEVSPSGESTHQFPTNGTEEDTELGYPAGNGIDISRLGVFYETNGGNVRYSSPSATIYSSFSVYANSVAAPLNSGLVIDRPTNGLFVDQGSYIDEFESECTGQGQEETNPGCIPSDSFGQGYLSNAAGLAVDPTSGLVYAANGGGGNIAVFTPLPVPDVSTGEASGAGPTAATLAGTIDPNGAGNVSACYFEWGTTASYGEGAVPCSQATPISSPTQVSAQITGLTPFQTYHYRLVGIREDGKGLPRYGRDRTFTSIPGGLPAIDGSGSLDATPTTAVVTGLVNPNAAPTVYRFQYGPTAGYGSQTATSEPIGEDEIDHAVSDELTGLEPGTTYHFRILAVNLHGITSGPDGVFSTPGAPLLGSFAATDVSADAATLQAEIHPDGLATSYHFEYGTSNAYGAGTPEEGPLAADNSPHTVRTAISSLSAGTTYHYRVVASNSFSSVAGPDQTFTTSPGSASLETTHCSGKRVLKQGKCVKPKGHQKHHHRRQHHRRKHHRRTH